MSDVRIIDQGTVVGFHMLTDEAEGWVADNVATEPWQWMGKILWVDHRMASALVEGMQAEGLALDAA